MKGRPAGQSTQQPIQIKRGTCIGRGAAGDKWQATARTRAGEPEERMVTALLDLVVEVLPSALATNFIGLPTGSVTCPFMKGRCNGMGVTAVTSEWTPIVTRMVVRISPFSVVSAIACAMSLQMGEAPSRSMVQ